MLGSGLISFTLPLFLIVKDPQSQSSRILVEPHLLDAEFRKAWMPLFCRSGHPVVTAGQFLDFVGHLSPQEPHLTRLRLYRFPGFLVFLFFWNWLRPLVSGRKVFWMHLLP